MDRRVCASLGLLGSLMVAAGAVACGSVAAEEKIVRDFFRASRMRDDATLSTFATASFDARREGQVQNFKVVSIGEERSHPLPIRKYAEALEQARAAQEAFSKEKLEYQKANIETMESGFAMIPKNTIVLEGKSASAILKLTEALEEHDDVQNVFSNFDIDEKEMEALA